MLFDEACRQAFLTKLTETLNASASARAVGVSKRTIFQHKADDPEFAQQWADALEEGLDLAEHSCNMRAFKGYLKPVFHQGLQCGEVREYSDSLAQFMLRGHRPEKFRDKLDLNVKGEITVVDRILAARKRAGG